MKVQVIEKKKGRINRTTGEEIKGNLRVCAYARVSTEKEEQINSYNSQLKYEVWNKAQEIYSKRSQKMIPNGNKHNSKYSLKYVFSSKIECGICGDNFVRRMNDKKKNGTSRIYWTCCNRVNKFKNCRNSKFVPEEILKDIFIQIYNSIISKKHQTKNKLLNAIKETLKEEDNSIKLEKLLANRRILEKRLSHLIDMKLDDYDNKNAYVLKEKEINSDLKELDQQIKNYEFIESNNKNIERQLKEIEKVLNAPKTIKDFDEEIFNNLVEKIIVGEKDENGNISPNIIRFILKIGTEYLYEINGNKNVSYITNEPRRFTNTRKEYKTS